MPSRHHRRATIPQGFRASARWRSEVAWLLAPQRLNWWIGNLFSIGSVCFALASALQLWPVETARFSASSVNWVYFLGSIPFTTAGGLVLMQAAHAPARPDTSEPGQMPFPGFKPRNLGWLSAALQFIGTLLFNINTFCGALEGLPSKMAMLIVWGPNFVGSLLFLASGLLGYLEAVHHWRRTEIENLSWWVVFVNLLGCLGFMVSALASFAPPGAETLAPRLALATTFQGALCFLLGALLSLAEAAHEAPRTAIPKPAPGMQ